MKQICLVTNQQHFANSPKQYVANYASVNVLWQLSYLLLPSGNRKAPLSAKKANLCEEHKDLLNALKATVSWDCLGVAQGDEQASRKVLIRGGVYTEQLRIVGGGGSEVHRASSNVATLNQTAVYLGYIKSSIVDFGPHKVWTVPKRLQIKSHL